MGLRGARRRGRLLRRTSPASRLPGVQFHGGERGSFGMAVNFGRAANEDLDLGGQFSVYAQAPSPLLGTRQHLQYRN